GKVDLAADPDDAIGSVAHYLARHGWQRAQPLMSPALIEEDGKDAVLQKLDAGVSERESLARWQSQSVAAFELRGDAAPDSAGLLILEEEGGPSYWLVFDNWFVITTYNRSRLYASAVVQLADALKDAARQRGP
ncbi:MAG TPA: lytic murein transglycosylase, partial [Casimicrobiaceae bacterium]|nr:lytic murein transglycosylase [Casimicrobiaceae bacterium]